MRRQILLLTIFLFGSALASVAGGPAFIAGSGYDPGVKGKPIIWANGALQYFTDPGDLSPIFLSAQADAFIAAAFNAWTSAGGVALTVNFAGHLDEDVNGSNIATEGFGVVTGPADITSSATSTPIGIIYDEDGTVTNALLGQGAGDIADCFSNAVYGGPDNFSTAGTIVHALVILNGVCAASNNQLPDMQYRLVRVIGRVLGLGWSQVNINVLTQKPVPTSSDFAGFPVMHFADPVNCVPISICYPNAGVPKMDDLNALAKLYPGGGAQPAAGRVYGSVYFTDKLGNAVQQMQGVNVVARLMVSGQPSRQYAVSSVSGFSFQGNAGNIINGYVDQNGLRYDRQGTNDVAFEGFFDLGQLTIPVGQTIAQYQLSVEALDPNWSTGVAPYGPAQVAPSGSFAPVVVTVVGGSNAERDILMLQSETVQSHPGAGSSYAQAAVLPEGGGWGSWISGYGSTDFFQFAVQANRTASISVVALDESGQPTVSKLAPVIGVWELSDESENPAPAATPTAFNTTTWGMTRLDAHFSASETYRVAVADVRGDGRPDYFYQARVLYADTLTPARLSLAGGVTQINGIGFSPGMQVTVAGNSASVVAPSASHLLIIAPPGLADGFAKVQVLDAATGAFSQMIGALTYGALASDLLEMLQGTESATAVGSTAPNAIRVRAVAADGTTPVAGATIAWSTTNGLQLSACNGSSFCSVLSDEAGEAYSWVTPTVAGQSIVTVKLAPASYLPPQTLQTTILGTSTALDLAAVTPIRWIGQGATIALPLTVEALNFGIGKPNVTVNYTVTKGAASLSSATATTNISGFASVTANLTNQNADVQISACVAPNKSPCQTFTLFSTPIAQWTVEAVSGSSQAVVAGELFRPLVVRVTDGTPAANPVAGVNVAFQITLARVPPQTGGPGGGDSQNASEGQPVLLGSSQVQFPTTQDGLASMLPASNNVGPCDVFITVAAGTVTAEFQMENMAPIVVAQPTKPQLNTPLRPSAAHFRASQPSAIAPLFAVPEFLPASDLAVDSQRSRDSDVPSDEAGTVHESSEGQDSKPPKPKRVIKARVHRSKVTAVRLGATTLNSASANAASARWTPRDRKSCRDLAGDGPLL